MAAGQVWRRQGAVCVPQKHDTMPEAALLPSATKESARVLGRRSATVPAPEQAKGGRRSCACWLRSDELPLNCLWPLQTAAKGATMNRRWLSPLLTWLSLAAALYARRWSDNETQHAHYPSISFRAHYQSLLCAKPDTASIHAKSRPDSSWCGPTGGPSER